MTYNSLMQYMNNIIERHCSAIRWEKHQIIIWAFVSIFPIMMVILFTDIRLIIIGYIFLLITIMMASISFKTAMDLERDLDSEIYIKYDPLNALTALVEPDNYAYTILFNLDELEYKLLKVDKKITRLSHILCESQNTQMIKYVISDVIELEKKYGYTHKGLHSSINDLLMLNDEYSSIFYKELNDIIEGYLADISVMVGDQ